ncbi:MAG: methionine adenosyltransferase [Thermodesulfovibrionales bacterium]|nr:methionine adenosyltransferase [Thermodesulfovibrionales bacterium]
MKRDFIFISESVTEGHPDKLCDQISDSIVDHFLQRDPFSRIRAECAIFTNVVFIAARFESSAVVDFPNIARQVINQVGYTGNGFNARSCSILTSIKELRHEHNYFDEKELTEEEIERIPAFDQATVFGFACNQTASYMPMPIWLAHKLSRRLTSVRFQNILSYLEPDGKTQVGVEYKNGRPHRIHSITIIVSQSSEKPDPKRLREDIIEYVIKPALHDEDIKMDDRTSIFINPEGPVIPGGPLVHSGLTGRKNAVDTYGEYARHSGSALSGKDPLRIDRVGAYAARYAAKNIVAAGLADECEVQLSYSIGISRPVSIQIETFGTGKIPDEEIARRINIFFDFRPAGIIKQFNLRYMPSTIKGGFYRKLASYGHVGRMDIGLPWELTDKAEMLK